MKKFIDFSAALQLSNQTCKLDGMMECGEGLPPTHQSEMLASNHVGPLSPLLRRDTAQQKINIVKHIFLFLNIKAKPCKKVVGDETTRSADAYH